MTVQQPEPVPGVSRVHAYEDALRGIAAATVQARARCDHMGRPSREDAGAYLAEVERHLAALIAVGAVPPPPDPERRGLTA